MYATLVSMAHDGDLQQRLMASAATKGVTNPESWVLTNRWLLVNHTTQPVVDAYQAGLDEGGPDALGLRSDILTDADVDNMVSGLLDQFADEETAAAQAEADKAAAAQAEVDAANAKAAAAAKEQADYEAAAQAKAWADEQKAVAAEQAKTAAAQEQAARAAEAASQAAAAAAVAEEARLRAEADLLQAQMAAQTKPETAEEVAP